MRRGRRPDGTREGRGATILWPAAVCSCWLWPSANVHGKYAGEPKLRWDVLLDIAANIAGLAPS
jgi:hypothetical protein